MWYCSATTSKISIHALLAESDIPHRFALWPPQRFLSTLSLRRATGRSERMGYPSANFYPRSPCGERLRDFAIQNRQRSISIHALLAESDADFIDADRHKQRFLSTLSLRRATYLSSPDSKLYDISIHALLAESDDHAAQYQRRLLISIHALLAESDLLSLSIV